MDERREGWCTACKRHVQVRDGLLMPHGRPSANGLGVEPCDGRGYPPAQPPADVLTAL